MKNEAALSTIRKKRLGPALSGLFALDFYGLMSNRLDPVRKFPAWNTTTSLYSVQR
jgi:hypothetical protein